MLIGRDLLLLYSYFEKGCRKKVHATIPKSFVGGFEVHCSSKKFEKMAQEAMDVCLQVLKKSNKRGLDSLSVRNSVLIISHFTFRDCHVHIFPTAFVETAVWLL